MAALVKGVFIVGAKRTVFGTYGGKLKNVSITELQTTAAKAALASANVRPETVDSTIIGIVGANSEPDGSLLARHVALKSDIPIEKPAYSVNRLCGSGFQSIVNGAQDIETGFSQISLTGGVENMSAYPHVLRGLRFGLPLGQSPPLEDSLWVGLTDTYCGLPMGLTAEKLGAQYEITRDEVDQFALRSQSLHKSAQDTGRFNEELVPVPVKLRKEVVDVTADEHPKPQTTLDGLKKLPTVFKKDRLVTAVSASNSEPDGIFLARHVALKSDIPIEKPAYAVNRLCGSGFQSIVNGAQDIETGFSQISLTGGVENMSAYPHVLRGLRFGLPLGQSPPLEDSLWVGLTDTYCGLPMGLTAEKLGAQYKITRDEVDQFALRSQTLHKAAQDAGRFNDELVPVPVKLRKEVINVTADEHPKPQTTLDGLKKLPTVFKKDGLVTAGSASGICDGAGAVVLASEQALSQNNLKPLARVVAYSVVGVEPSIMGIGPAPAIQAILKATGKTLNDIDLIEINEAFGAQVLAVAKELSLDINKLNVDGGAIALGHPLAASGSRITTHLVHELRRRKAKFGIGSACIGGGQGIAILVEAL